MERIEQTPDDEAFAVWLAEYLNGGKFYDPQFYTEEQRELWRTHAGKIKDRVVSDWMG